MMEDRTQDEAAIRAIVQQVMAGWNAGSGAGFAAPFADNADYVIVNGDYVQGREVIAAGHQHLFDTFYRGSHNEMAVESVRFLRPDVAVARVHAHLQTAHHDAANARSTWVLTKEGEGWQIASFQNTPMVPRQQ